MNMGMEVLSPSSYIHNSGWLFQDSRGAMWTPEENKLFENALAVHDKDTPDRWARVAAMIPGKTVGDVIKQYKELLEDVSDIEAGLIPIPGYGRDCFTLDWFDGHGYDVGFSPSRKGTCSRTSEQERKKGVPWTEEEHRQFLMGLQKYGKGYWRNISRNFVTTRTPTQVASHAQKYFIRQATGGKDKRRSSIHDITTAGLPDTKSPPPDQNGYKQSSPEHHQTANATATTTMQQKMVGFGKRLFDRIPQNEGAAPALNSGANSFLSKAPICGVSFSPGYKLQEQNMLGGSLSGYQFGSHHNMFFSMQSLQQP